MNELSTTRTPEIIGIEIRTIQKSAFEYNLRCAVEIGRRLTEAKELVAHGEWLDWLKRETGYSQPSASRFMKVYERLGAEQIGLEGAELAEKYSMLNNLESSKIFLLVSMPEKDMDEFLDEHPVEELKAGTVNELKEAIRERDEARNALKEAEQTIKDYAEENVTLTDDLANAERRVKELESRPVDVAVAEPDPAEIERRAKEIAEADIKAAVAEAEKKADDEREKLQKKLEKAEAAKKKAEDDAANAGNADKAEAEKLRAEAEEAKGEIERLRKQLAMSDGSVATFKIHFENWQMAHDAMMQVLTAVPIETADKLRAAINAVIKGWEEADND